jgi:preprotein translocase subunit YajC
VSFIVVMVLLLVVMWVLMIRPQRQRQREHQTMIDRAGVGDDILTTGGIYGTIEEVDGDDIVVELADGLSVHMTRRGIAAVLPPEDEEEDEDDDEPAELEAIEDETPDEDLSAEELRERTREGAV